MVYIGLLKTGRTYWSQVRMHGEGYVPIVTPQQREIGWGVWCVGSKQGIRCDHIRHAKVQCRVVVILESVLNTPPHVYFDERASYLITITYNTRVGYRIVATNRKYATSTGAASVEQQQPQQRF